MLFLFNSAAKPEYVKNLLSTLSLPSGAINEYQYSQTSSDYNYVDVSADPNGGNNLKGIDVLILLMDKSKAPFMYYPLRKGSLISAESRAGRVYYKVELGDYVFSEEISQFNLFLQNNFGEYLFSEIHDKNGMRVSKGYYAFAYDGDISAHIMTGEDNWIKIVHQIERCENLEKDSHCVFTKISIKDGEKILMPSRREKEWFYKLKLLKKYSVAIDYYFSEESECEAECSLKTPSDLVQIDPQTYETGNRQGVVYFTLHTKQFGKGSIMQGFSQGNREAKALLRAAHKPLEFKIGINRKRVIFVAILLAILFVCNVTATINADAVFLHYGTQIDKDGMGFYQKCILWLANLVNDYCEIVPTIAASISAVVTAAIAWIFGKKK